MDPRREKLLLLVVENHITTAGPVGSKFLVSENHVDWSEATVRNELRALEEEGYLTHPHTSAGRIPTVKGFRYYVDRINFSESVLSKEEKNIIKKSAEVGGVPEEVVCKNIAKALAHLSQEAVLIAFSKDIIYYTGLSNLFQKPDFGEIAMVANISQVFDHCENYVERFFDQVEIQPRYFIGNEHNFGNLLSVLSARFGHNQESLIALFGPQRMNYRRNWALLSEALTSL